MAGSFTAAFSQAIMERIITKTTADLLGSTVWLHLYSSTIDDTVGFATTGRVGTTAAATNYDSVSIVNSTTTWTVPSSTSPSTFENKIVLSATPSSGASTGWQTIKAFALASSSSTSAGLYWAWGDVIPNQTVSAGNTVQMATGALDITLGGGAAT